MSKRKNKKQKQIAEIKNKVRKDQIKKLEELKSKALALEVDISIQKKDNFKQLNIRNLKVFKSICNFAAPFVVSSGIAVSGFAVFGGGFPFYTDEITKYKIYNLDFQTNGNVTMNDSYVESKWYVVPSNSLVVYTSWEKQDDKYIRFKKEYDIGKLTTLDLYNAVLDENYDYICDNLKNYKEEKQITNKIDSEEDNNYFFEASLHILDKEDNLKYNESDLKNMIITIMELGLALGVGALVTHFRKFDFTELDIINNIIKEKNSCIKSMKQELEDTNAKILSITKGSKK